MNENLFRRRIFGVLPFSMFINSKNMKFAIYKSRDDSVLWQNITDPPLIKQDVALAIGKLLLYSRWPLASHRRDIPLEVEDRGEYWRVLGKIDLGDQGGTYCLILRKRDCLVVDIGVYMPPGRIPDPPS